MPTKIFVGNLSDDSKSDDLQSLFEQYGQVVECDILRNFGFVHMKDENEAKAAIEALNGFSFDGLKMNVEISHSKPRGGGGGGGRGGGGGGPIRRGGSSRGSARGRGGGRVRDDNYGRQGRDRYDPYDRFPPPRDMYDLYERMLPLPSLSYERRLPSLLPRDYRGRDPYARPPPDFYRRSPEEFYERIIDLQRRYEEELFDLYYGPPGSDVPKRVGATSRPPNPQTEGQSQMGGGAAFDNTRQALSSFNRGYAQDFTSDSFFDEPAGPSGSDGRAQGGLLADAVYNLAQKIQNSGGKSNMPSGYGQQQNNTGPSQDFFDPVNDRQSRVEQLYSSYS